MDTLTCPECGNVLTEMDRGGHRCQNCGAPLPYEAAEQPGEHVAEFDRFPKYAGSPLPLESTWPEAKIRRSDHGETLAVLALLLPLVAQSVALACRFDSLGIYVALGWGTVIVTALVLAVDAAFLGTMDLEGKERSGPVALFFGMLVIWIICYPVAFFRRRHYGRPNLGPLAILVAGFFVGVPFVQQFAAFGTVGGGLPTCTSREVIAMVDDLIRKSPMGPSVESISGHRETSFDSVKQIRKGQCQVKTRAETIPATYNVRWLNRQAGTFQVEVEPIFPADPPSCNDAEVIAILEPLIREGPNGHLVRSLIGHEETSYDRERKIRHGRCQAVMQGRARNVEFRYRVYWIDQKTGQFQVEIEP